MMPMTFYASSNVTLLFDFWDVHDVAGMVLTMVLILLLTVAFELLKVYRVWLGNRSKQRSGHGDQSFILERSQSESTAALEAPPPAPRSRDRWAEHALQTALHALQVSLGYTLMLCVMTYNFWIFLAVVLGAAIGYFLSFPLLGGP